MKKILILAIVALLLGSCVTINLKRNLTPPLKDWLEHHELIMDGKVPRWLDERGGTEHTHFLRLPTKMQILYTHFFWKIRPEDAKEEYYGRMAWANRYYNGWNKDRGYVFLLCGSPFSIRYLHNESGSRESSINGYIYQIWDYILDGMFVRVAFEYVRGEWRLAINSTGSISNYRRLIDYNKKLFHPTEEGYEIWGNRLLAWVKEQERKL